jgi:hypothetical protein
MMTKVQEFIAEKCGEGGEYVLDERSTKLEKALSKICQQVDGLSMSAELWDDIHALLADNVAGEAELLERFHEWMVEDSKISGVPDAKQRIMELEVKLQDLYGAVKVWQESDRKQRRLLFNEKERADRLATVLRQVIDDPNSAAARGIALPALENEKGGAS